MIRLETKRLVIRDHQWSDLESHHRLLTDEAVMQYLPDIMTRSIEESRENLRLSIGEINNPNRALYFLRIEDKQGELVGEVGYTVTEFSERGKIGNLGYFIFEKFWGQGYVTEAVKEVLRFAFTENDVWKITTGCLEENIGSEKVMIKCGFKKENKELTQEHKGQIKPRVSYCMTKEEWLEKIITPKGDHKVPGTIQF